MEVAKRVMAVNYFGAVALAKGLLTAQTTKPGVRAGPHFVVINSVQGKFGMAHRSSYCASKHALIGFFDCLRAETAHLGVRVTTVLPGYVRTRCLPPTLERNSFACTSDQKQSFLSVCLGRTAILREDQPCCEMRVRW